MEESTSPALQADEAAPTRRRTGAAVWRLLSTACRGAASGTTLSASGLAHQAAPPVRVEVLAAAVRADKGAKPRSGPPILLDALERILAVEAVKMRTMHLIGGLKSGVRNSRVLVLRRVVCVGCSGHRTGLHSTIQQQACLPDFRTHPAKLPVFFRFLIR